VTPSASCHRRGQIALPSAPALFLPRPVIVVSPLTSPMQDQHDKLAAARIEAARLDSTVSATEESRVMADPRRGEPELVYVTPERLENAEYVDVLARAGASLFVVDEAHCVSQWATIPARLSRALRDAIQRLGRPPVLALTATATPTVIADILKQLAIEGAEVMEGSGDGSVTVVFGSRGDEDDRRRLAQAARARGASRRRWRRRRRRTAASSGRRPFRAARIRRSVCGLIAPSVAPSM
jgi:ATP-dependent DNA helicase RecQ